MSKNTISALKARVPEWKAVLGGPWKWLVLVPLTFLGIYQEIQQQFLPNWPSSLPISPLVWFIIALILAIIFILEGAYRRIMALRKMANELQSNIDRMIEETLRPRIALGKQQNVSLTLDENKQMAQIVIHPSFCNAGQRTAYRIHMRSGFAPALIPSQFVRVPDLDVTNPLDAQQEFGPRLPVRTPFRHKGKEVEYMAKEIMMYCGFEYFDAQVGGHRYQTEFWFLYPVGTQLASPSLEQQEALEPYVRKVF